MRALLAALLILAAAPAVAAAQPAIGCDAADADVVEIDGMLDDWTGVKPVRAGGSDRDASFDLRCLIAGGTLWIAADVRDEHVTRTPGGAGDDALQLTIGTLVIVVRPGVDKKPPQRTVGGKAAPRWLGVEDTLQPAGWSVELAIPVGKIAGWSGGVTLGAQLRDGDVPRGKTIEHVVAWSGAILAAAQAAAVDLRAAFLADARLPASAVLLDQVADVDRSRPGSERVVVAGDRVGLLTDRFAFVTVPVSRATDVVTARLIDLRGDGSKVVAVVVRLRAGDAIRDLVMLWAADGGALASIGAIEIARTRGDQRLRSTWKVVAGKPWAKPTRGARKVIEVRAEPAVGWDEDSFVEPRATDAEPIHVPWDDDRIGGVFWLGASGQLETVPIARKR